MRHITGSDVLPVSDQPGDNFSAVNYSNHDGLDNGFNDGYAILGTVSDTEALTDVGAYREAGSSYGTFDQNGNVIEWTEALINGSYRGWRGGGWFTNSLSLSSSSRLYGACRLVSP